MRQDPNDTTSTKAFASELKTLKGSTAAIKSGKSSSAKGAPRTATSSFAKQIAPVGKPSFDNKPTGDPELDRVLGMIKKYVDQTTGVPSGGVSGTTASGTKAGTKSSTTIAKTSPTGPSKTSGKVGSLIGRSKPGTKGLAKATPEAVAYKFAGEIARQTLMRDAANTINQVIDSARQITDKMVVKQVHAEGQINETISQTEQTASDLLQNINDVSTQADDAMKYINQLKDQALYAHNAAGQAMAAQMAQAMGFPISAKGITSPFPPPPSIQQASIGYMIAIISVAKASDSGRRSFI
jgi:hypothetical protein